MPTHATQQGQGQGQAHVGLRPMSAREVEVKGEGEGGTCGVDNDVLLKGAVVMRVRDDERRAARGAGAGA